MTRHGLRLVVVIVAIASVFVVPLAIAPSAGATVGPLSGTWTIEPSPNPVGAFASGLDAVSCSGPGSCIAVGSSSYPSGHQAARQISLIEKLSNGAWTIESNPTLRGATASPLEGVSCPTSGFCVAVGYVQYTHPHFGLDALAETWNGTTWRKDSLPAPEGGTEASLAEVSCAAKGVCVAVGNYVDTKADTYRPLAERLDGHTWSVMAAPDPRGASNNSEFTGIDCSTQSSCEAVGDVAYNDTEQNVFAYALSGSTWTYQHQVNPQPTPGDSDNAVSCSGADSCTSVGSTYVVAEYALAEYWNGSTWVRQTTPAPANRPETTLVDVSCVGGMFCVTVGASAAVNQKNGHLRPYHVMAEVWNGTSWSQSPPVGANKSTIGLSGVSCPSPTACVAVGASSTKSSATTLVEDYTA
jgi:hypothetical protein